MLMPRKLKLLLKIAGVVIGSLLFSPSTTAQVTPDGSLSTTVEQSGGESTIDGGERAGDNLFHSFRDFSVSESGSASFNNASDVVNIFNRVTGGNVSQINGLIRANGTANLFLINPAGIIFGEGSSLDIGGSFYGGTADSILFPDGIEFSASNLDVDPILTINAPIGFNLREDSGTIVNRSIFIDEDSIFPVGLKVNEGESITLEANQIRFESGLLTAPGGSINLRAIGNIAIAGNIFDFALDTASEEGDGGRIEVDSSNGEINFININIRSGSSTSDNGGQIDIFARNALILEDSSLTSSVESGTGGNISLESATSIEMIDTRLDTGAFGDRKSGDISITALNNGAISFFGRQDSPAEILADAFGSGEGLEDGQTGGDLAIVGGDITIDNYQLISIVNFNPDINPNTDGNGGDISVQGDNITIINNSTLETLTEGEGAAGNIILEGSNLTLDNSEIEASNRPPGDVNSDSVGGNIDLQFTGIVSLSNNSSIIAAATNNASGGNINIDSQFIIAFPSENNGNDIIASAQAGTGGNIDLNTESIFNLESRINQPNNGTNDIDASSQLGIDGNVIINTISVNKIPGIVGLSVDLINVDEAIAYSCAAETGTSGLAINGKGGIPESPDAPLISENINVDRSFSDSATGMEQNPAQKLEQSIETGDGKIDLAMRAIERENGTISLVSSHNLGDRQQKSSLSNCI